MCQATADLLTFILAIPLTCSVLNEMKRKQAEQLVKSEPVTYGEERSEILGRISQCRMIAIDYPAGRLP